MVQSQCQDTNTLKKLESINSSNNNNNNRELIERFWKQRKTEVIERFWKQRKTYNAQIPIIIQMSRIQVYTTNKN